MTKTIPLDETIIQHTMLSLVRLPENERSRSTVVMPVDGTVPQNTEGVECARKAITPSHVGARIRVDFYLEYLLSDPEAEVALALFMDDEENARWAFMNSPRPGGLFTLSQIVLTADNAENIIFKFRVGPSSGTMTYSDHPDCCKMEVIEE